MKTWTLLVVSILTVVAFLSSCIPIGDMVTLEIPEMYTGRVYHVKATYTSGFSPVSGVRLKFQYYDGSSWRDLQDFLTGQEIFETDYNGEVEIAVFPVRSGTLKIKAVSIDNPEVYEEGQTSVSKATWGILLFMIADNNLEDFAWDDYNEAKNSNPEVFIVSILDTKSYGDYIRVLDENGDWVDAPLSHSGDINTGDPSWLKSSLDFLRDLESQYKGLILWDHGSAWMYDSHVMSENDQPRIIGIDETSGDGLSIAEVRQAIENSFGSQKIDLIGMDACLMSSLEIAYELRNNARYFLASAFSEPGSGWDYSFLEYISSSTDPVNLGMTIIDLYFSSTDVSPLSLALWDLSSIHDLASAVSNLGYRLVDVMNSDPDLIDRILDYYDYDVLHYGEDEYYLLVDIGDFAKALYNNEGDSQLRWRAQQTIYALESALVYGRMYPNLGSYGLSIFFPTTADGWNAFVSDLNVLSFYTYGDVPGLGYFLYNFLLNL